MKRVAVFLASLALMLTIFGSSVFAYQKNDIAIQLVRFTVSGMVSSDLNDVRINVTVPQEDKYYYMGHEILDPETIRETGVVTVKLKFHSSNHYYFKITKASQIAIPKDVKYISASREDDGYQLHVVVKFPANTEISSTEYNTGWLESHGFWYYRLPDGKFAREWKQIDGEWYYFYFDGRMAASEWLADTYYVDENGRMLHDTVTPDGYTVGSDGKRLQASNTSGPGEFKSMEAILEEFKNALAGDDTVMTDIHIEGDNIIAMTHAISGSYSDDIAQTMVASMDRDLGPSWRAISAAYSEEHRSPVFIKVYYTYNGRTLLTMTY